MERRPEAEVDRDRINQIEGTFSMQLSATGFQFANPIVAMWSVPAVALNLRGYKRVHVSRKQV